MNTIEQVFGTSATTTNNAVGQKAEDLGQEDFLKLLVAQLKNQDPNNPADNGEFLGQIAQFSMVSGIDELGVSFDGIAGSLYSTQAIQASNLVGKEVLADTPVVSLIEGESVEGMLDLEGPAENIQLQVLDASGSLVGSVDLGSAVEGSHRFKWDGLKEDGTQAPSGDYFLQVEGLSNGQLEGLPFQIYTRVDSVSVDRTTASISLQLANQDEISLSQVSEFR